MDQTRALPAPVQIHASTGEFSTETLQSSLRGPRQNFHRPYPDLQRPSCRYTLTLNTITRQAFFKFNAHRKAYNRDTRNLDYTLAPPKKTGLFINPVVAEIPAAAR